MRLKIKKPGFFKKPGFWAVKNQTPHLLKYPKRLLGQNREELERVAYVEIPNRAEKYHLNP